MGKKGAFVFLKDPDNAWIPAKLTSQAGNTADVQIPIYKDEQSTICDGGRGAKQWIEAEVDLTDYAKGVLPMQNVDESGNGLCFADMVELPFLHEVRTDSDDSETVTDVLPITKSFMMVPYSTITLNSPTFSPIRLLFYTT
jgi:hypothetical protein